MSDAFTRRTLSSSPRAAVSASSKALRLETGEERRHGHEPDLLVRHPADHDDLGDEVV
jgi:hypothetical protein